MPHFAWHSPSAIAHTHCGFSLKLNKSTSYLTLCLSLNYFCDEASRTWASLGSETRYCGVWLGSIPKLSLSWFESKHMSSSPSWVQLLSHDWLLPPCTAACQAFLSIINSRSLLKLRFIELMMPSNHLVLCRPLLLLPSIFPSIRVFSDESAIHIRWPKYWSFSFSISPSNEYSGLISFRMDWLDLLAVQGTLKSLLQQHSSKAPIFWHLAFFIIQL